MQRLPRLAIVAATALALAACQRPAPEPATPAPAATATTPAAASVDAADPRATIQTQRAAQAAIWGMPVVNYDLMRQQMLAKTSGKANQVIYWGHPLDWHNQTLTPNPDTIYLMTFFDTRKTGPLVLEIPAASEAGSLNANIVDAWQVPLQDAGRLGEDQGKGMKLLILPPDYQGKPPSGYTVLRPATYGGYALIRSNMASHDDKDVARSIDYARQVKLYPLSQAAKPPPTVFTDVGQADFDSTIRYDETFFDNLNHVVQEEPWLDRDRAMIDVLKSVGIEKGKPYDPSPELKQRQREGMKLAQAYLGQLYDEGFPAFYEGTHWMYPTHPELVKAASGNFADPDQYPVDYRGLGYTYAYIAIKNLGAGQFYMIAIKDKDAKPFDGAQTYRLHVPAKPPISQYWSVTAYDRQTHALIKQVPRASRASNAADLVKNEDGSVDLYIGPKAPAGKDANWIPTDPQRGFELMFRAYGPDRSFFDKQWTLPDVEPVR